MPCSYFKSSGKEKLKSTERESIYYVKFLRKCEGSAVAYIFVNVISLK